MGKKFLWTEQYSVHVAKIDEQHKQFIEICNGLLELADSESYTEEEALKRVMQLGDYAFYHFGTEEELFTKTKYPDAGPHVAVHNLFRRKAEEFIGQVRNTNMDTRKVIKEIVGFTTNWLFDHILVMDQKYSKYFNDHGIK